MKCKITFYIVLISIAPAYIYGESRRRDQNLDGKWIIDSDEYNGVELIDRENGSPDNKRFIIIKNGNLSLVFNNDIVATGKIQADFAKFPNQLDVSIKHGPTIPGIFVSTSNFLIVSLSLSPNEDRPTSFNSTDKRNNTTVLVLRRIKSLSE